VPQFAANITFLFTELPFLDRFAAAAAAGFRGVEFHYPYDQDPDAIRARLDEHRLVPVLMNIRAGDHKAGEWGFAGVPGREETFQYCVTEAIEYAGKLGVTQLNCLAGVRSIGNDGIDCAPTLIDNLRYTARVAAEAKITINLEPLNTIDVPRYLVASSDYALYVIDEVGAPNLKLQYDWYHMRMMGEDLVATTQRLLPHIGHIQFADAPGRHEPGTGEVDFAALFALVDKIGYEGWVSAEYRPSMETSKTLGWLPKGQRYGY
jgi:hydroxypyruvate isomerase